VRLPVELTPLIVALTLAGVAVGRYPRLRMNRATIALTGATLLILAGGISLTDAYRAIDLDTLALLFAMMIIVANLQLSGFFRLVGARIVFFARSPRALLALVIGTSGVLAAVFLNDTVVLMFTPLVLEVALALGRSPVPYLVALATAANIGSTATITGNPQNMIIGIASGIPFNRFALHLAPVAAAGLFADWAIIAFLYRREFPRGAFAALGAAGAAPGPHLAVRVHRPTMIKALVATALMLAGFVAGVPVPLAALAAAALLLVTRRLKPERVFQEIDWSLLVFFAGLFVVTGAIETSGLSRYLVDWGAPVAERGTVALAGVAVIVSNVVSNVPAVLLFRPLIPRFPSPETAWLTLAMATTLAGNLTLLGSVANLIVAESARRRGVTIGFVEYLKAGVPVTLATVAIGALWLSLFG
jgi:Na+/H+ antiporter NhaD/arsenite permease-like protein